MISLEVFKFQEFESCYMYLTAKTAMATSEKKWLIVTKK